MSFQEFTLAADYPFYPWRLRGYCKEIEHIRSRTILMEICADAIVLNVGSQPLLPWRRSLQISKEIPSSSYSYPCALDSRAMTSGQPADQMVRKICYYRWQSLWAISFEVYDSKKFFPPRCNVLALNGRPVYLFICLFIHLPIYPHAYEEQHP